MKCPKGTVFIKELSYCMDQHLVTNAEYSSYEGANYPVSEDYGVPPQKMCEWDGCETVSVDEYFAVGDSYERVPKKFLTSLIIKQLQIPILIPDNRKEMLSLEAFLKKLEKVISKIDSAS